MTDALQHLIDVVRRGMSPETTIAALERWLLERPPAELLPEEAAPAFNALVMETEALALLALLDASSQDSYPSDEWHELVSRLTWRRALAARATELAGGDWAHGFDEQLDAALERRFAGDVVSAPMRARARDTWAGWPSELRWWSALSVSAPETESDGAADSEFGPYAGLVEWARQRQGSDGRVRLTNAEWDLIAASEGGEDLLLESEHLFECVHEPISAAEWQAGAVALRHSAPRRFSIARVPVPLRLAASTSSSGGAWTPGHGVLFQFAATRAWIHPGVGLLAAGQAPDASVDGPPRAAWLVVPERGVTRIEWNGGAVEVEGLGGLVIPVNDPSVRFDVVALHGAAGVGVSLPSEDYFGDGVVLLDDSGIDDELTAVLADIRAADFSAAKGRLDAMDGRLIAGERPTVHVIRALLAEGGAS